MKEIELWTSFGTDLPKEFMNHEKDRRFYISDERDFDTDDPIREASYQILMPDGSWQDCFLAQQVLHLCPGNMIEEWFRVIVHASASKHGGFIRLYTNYRNFKKGGEERWYHPNEIDPMSFYPDEDLPPSINMGSTLSNFFSQIKKLDFSKPTLYRGKTVLLNGKLLLT